MFLFLPLSDFLEGDRRLLLESLCFFFPLDACDDALDRDRLFLRERERLFRDADLSFFRDLDRFRFSFCLRDRARLVGGGRDAEDRVRFRFFAFLLRSLRRDTLTCTLLCERERERDREGVRRRTDGLPRCLGSGDAEAGCERGRRRSSTLGELERPRGLSALSSSSLNSLNRRNSFDVKYFCCGLENIFRLSLIKSIIS